MSRKEGANRPHGSKGAAILLTLFLGPGMGHFLIGAVGRGFFFIALTLAAGIAAGAAFMSSVSTGMIVLALGPLAYVAAIVDIVRTPQEKLGPSRILPLLVGLAVMFGAPIVAAIIIRMTIIEAFKVPASSMAPTLVSGDHVFADKRASVRAQVTRGDIIVFPYPPNPEQSFVKRVVGVGGDRIEVRASRLFVNDAAVPRCEVGGFETTAADSTRTTMFLWVEFFEGRTFLVLTNAGGGASDGSWTVPEGELFVMGDNRDNSHDSRQWYEGRGGTVKAKDVTGVVRHRFLRGQQFALVDVTTLELPAGAESLKPKLDECLANPPK